MSAWPRAPKAMTSLFRSFPLLCHPSQQLDDTAAPSKPTLWILGPGIAGTEASYDVRSLRRQAELRFRGVEYEVMTWENEDGGVEGRLPSLHLPDGTLLADHAIDAWLDKTHPRSTKEDAAVLQEAAAWYALVETKLFPALLAHLFLEPLFETYTIPLYHRRATSSKSPLLAQVSHSIVARSHRARALTDVRALVGSSGSIDIEDLETEAADALESIARRMDVSGWFLGTSTALPIDAALFAHLHAFLALPSLKTDSPKTTNRLRAAVERHEQLCQWTRRLDRRYFDG